MVTVYILYSEQTDRYYTGITKNLRTRLQKHPSGQNRSSSYASDWKVIWLQETASYDAARDLEARIKARGAARFLES
jgi:predicted GIY-YIG superfamily endonuclease